MFLGPKLRVRQKKTLQQPFNVINMLISLKFHFQVATNMLKLFKIEIYLYFIQLQVCKKYHGVAFTVSLSWGNIVMLLIN